MNFQVLNIAILCVVFQVGMPIWLLVNCAMLLAIDLFGIGGLYLEVMHLRVQQAVETILLVVHVAWIANHLRWVANDQIDPWKLGGYGMYTVPSRHVHVALTSVLPSGDMGPRFDAGNFKAGALMLRNDGMNVQRTFRCKPVGPGALRAFFEDNPSLQGEDMIILYLEARFYRNPVEMPWHEQGRVQIQWIGDRDLVYGSLFCGNVVTGEVSLS